MKGTEPEPKHFSIRSNIGGQFTSVVFSSIFGPIFAGFFFGIEMIIINFVRNDFNTNFSIYGVFIISIAFLLPSLLFGFLVALFVGLMGMLISLGEEEISLRAVMGVTSFFMLPPALISLILWKLSEQGIMVGIVIPSLLSAALCWHLTRQWHSSKAWFGRGLKELAS